jgi:hypothetical protein
MHLLVVTRREKAKQSRAVWAGKPYLAYGTAHCATPHQQSCLAQAASHASQARLCVSYSLHIVFSDASRQHRPPHQSYNLTWLAI